MNYIHFSGGGTKGIGQLGFYSKIHGRMKFDVGSGVSIGAAILLPCLMGKHEDAIRMFDGINLRTFFNVPPVTRRGKIHPIAIWRALQGKSLGDQDNLVDRIREIVSEQEFEDWKANSGQKAYVGSVDFGTGSLIVRELSELSYEDMLMAVLASASIPIYTEPVTHFGLYEYDGGVRSHVIAAEALSRHMEPTKRPAMALSVAVFTRPEQPVHDKIWRVSQKKIEAQASILERALDLMAKEISRNDEQLHKEYCDNHSIGCKNVFLPNILRSPYDVDEARLHALYYEGLKEGDAFVEWLDGKTLL